MWELTMRSEWFHGISKRKGGLKAQKTSQGRVWTIMVVGSKKLRKSMRYGFFSLWPKATHWWIITMTICMVSMTSCFYTKQNKTFVYFKKWLFWIVEIIRNFNGLINWEWHLHKCNVYFFIIYRHTTWCLWLLLEFH